MVESESQFPLYFYGEKTKKKLHLYEVFIKKKPNVFCTTNKEEKKAQKLNLSNTKPIELMNTS